MTHPSYQRAMILHQQGRHGDAANELRQALAHDPHDPFSHAMLAVCLADLQKYADATQEAGAAIGLAPELPFAHYAMAKVMYSRHFYDEATASIREAIALDPFNASYHGMHGFILFEQNKWPAALEAAERGLQIDPDNDWCTNLRAMALVKLGRKDEASATIHGALEKDPENAHTHANQGWTYLHRGDAKQAMVHFKEALRLDPTLQWAQAGMVEALKARNPLYRWMLAWFLFMSRLNQRAQFAIIIGGYVGYRFALNTAQTNPALAPYLWPIVIAYICFAVLSWLADPLSNLALRLHPQGKYALSRDQRVGATWVALCLTASLISLGIWFKTRSDTALGAAIMLGLLLLPVSIIFKCASGWPRWTMSGVVGLLLLFVLGSTSLSWMGERNAHSKLVDGFAILLFNLFLYGVLIASFGASWLVTVRPRK